MDARPTLDEVLEARAGRAARIEALVRDATDESLARVVDRPNGGTTTVGDCIRVVLREEWWYHRYADRDLAVLTGRATGA